ncbi:hypothetical protein CIHG_09752 [Coccidioides immitis H538.4]|uniref:Uncharacterized protein n=2 Tax=Coccidioides immitis TaxID=5501 RepID=A0A0J8QR61_COCIT|nr:hypothetical protein CISG_10364 [Coccidioides immitis RMSCC 3703]KMU91944.1 hypothetical protein CIHG_09752 [Coccidioides immitis H538.4]
MQLVPEMCFQMRKTPARWPDCTGGIGPCSTHEPDHDYIQWCKPAEQRGSQCESPTPTSQASSTKRKRNCPNHRSQGKPKSDEGDAGAGGGSVSQPHGVKVGA